MKDRAWTLQALHLACGMARRGDTKLVLLRFVPVTHLRWAGTGENMELSRAERADLDEYCQTAEDYGVELSFYQRQVHTLDSAIAETAEMIEASVVFATLPETAFRPWRAFQMRHLEKRLNEQHCLFNTLEAASKDAVWSPAAAFPLSR